MILFVSKCLSNVIIYIWFLNIILNMHFFKDSHVFFPFEETCISNIFLDAPSCGLRREDKSFFPPNRNYAF